MSSTVPYVFFVATARRLAAFPGGPYTDGMSHDETLRKEFDRFDADTNGYIDEAEFSALVHSLDSTLTGEKAAIAFLALDVNGNGRIEFGEFSAWWKRYRSR